MWHPSELTSSALTIGSVLVVALFASTTTAFWMACESLVSSLADPTASIVA